MSFHLHLVSRIRRIMGGLSDLLAKYWKQNFYLYLAALFTVLAVLDNAVFHVTSEMRQAAFDTMVRYRVVVPKPDPDIVIVDINEASLAAMAQDYGRWPWPRQVLGEFVEQIEKQQPKAVIFDVLFSDADIYNADSDAYFDAAIAGTNNTFFPMLRLDASSDTLSQLKPSMIPGVRPLPEATADENATVAMVLPHFQSALDGGRLGLHNITPDADGVARRYQVYSADYGWRIPSLPDRVASELGWPVQPAREVLLNWRGQPFTYQYVSFSDVFADMTSKDKKRAADEFKDKIVLIGSTAPSLFDIKATPMNKTFPGVEILATAIDNFKHGDALRFPEGRIWYLALTLLIVWLTAWAFYRDVGRDKTDKLFGLSQFILIGITYASINFTNTYINLTGPVTVGLAFFMIARLYASATGKALEQNMVRAAAARDGELRAALMLIRLDDRDNVMTDALMKKLRHGLERAGTLPKSVDVLNGDQKGLWDLFENTIAVSWVEEGGQGDAFVAAVDTDAQVLADTLQTLLQKHIARSEGVALWFTHHGSLSGGDGAREGWRRMFGETLLAWKRTA